MNIIGRGARHCRRRSGLTLIECMLALTIFPLAVVAVAYAIVAGQSQAAEAHRQMQAAMLTEGLMEEILALPQNPEADSTLGPEGGETGRALFDSPNDFHGFSEEAGSLADATGTAYPQTLQGFGRSVSCASTSVTVAGLGDPVTGLEVTVTVTRNDDAINAVTRFIADPS